MKFSRSLLLTLAGALAVSGCARDYAMPELPDVFKPSEEVAKTPEAEGGELKYYNEFVEDHQRAIYFASAVHEISHTDRELLDGMVEKGETFDAFEFVIEGHTDTVGSEKDNDELSQNRVNSVVAYLHEKNVPAHAIRVKAHSERKPAVKGDSEYRHLLNRRVIVTLKRPK